MTTGGGAATHAGTDYQNRVAAWTAVHLLAEQEATPPWDLPPHTVLEFIRCETEQPVDDLLVGSSEGGYAFVQVKRRLNLETSPTSDLASTLDQFVRQVLSGRSTVRSDRPWERELEADRDRLVLATSSDSSGRIREQLPLVLGRLRTLLSGQPLEDAAANEHERAVLNVVRDLVRQSLEAATGEASTRADVISVLRLVWVQVLDVSAGGRDEREVKNLLRSSVLKDPAQADLAWNTLVGMCANLARSRSGSDRPQLQEALVRAGIDVKAPRSYRGDIDLLKRYSRSTAESLAGFSKVQVGSTEIKVSRRVTETLRNTAEAGPLLVIGEPGAGKSGAIHDFVDALDRAERDVVFMAVNYLKAESVGSLRQEVGLTHELDEVLANWPGNKPAFLVIDALDAARSEDSARTFRQLISKVEEMPGRWRVVASIRKFDLRYGVELQRIFRGNPPSEFHDDEFPNVRHVNIPLLSDEEMALFGVWSPVLAELLTMADEVLSDLLRVPFNMRLAGELLGEGVSASDLTPIRTQIGLLDRYWHERVIRSDSFGDAREALLRSAAQRMVEDRALRIDRTDIGGDPSASFFLNEVLSSNVLAEWQPSPEVRPERYVLTFSHHVLFDYAAARLLLRGRRLDSPVTLIEREPDLVLAIRPSLVFHFQHLWLLERDHTSFWELVLLFARNENIPEVGKLIGCGVAVDQGVQVSDFDPLLAAMSFSDADLSRAAEKALSHVVGAILVTAQTDSDRLLVGEGTGPWAELLERVARSLNTHNVAPTVRVLLNALCAQPEHLTVEQRDLVGQTARRLLEFAWRSPDTAWMTPSAIEAVCRTFESDPVSSAILLRRSLEPDHLAEHGYGELPYLAYEIERLAPVDPQLVEDIYRAAFTYDEESQDVTSVGMSNIVPLRSTRKQDFQMARYQLAESYPAFIREAALNAVRALIATVDAYAARQGAYASTESAEEAFDFRGQRSSIRTDYSGVWDAGNVYREDDTLKMLDAFEEHLRALADDHDRAVERRELLDIVARENSSAAIWRRILACGTTAPNTLGREIRELAWALPILTNIDTTTAAGNFVGAIFAAFDRQDRELVERAILSIPASVEEDRETAEMMRNRLLGCLPSDSLMTDEARRLVPTLNDRSSTPPNEPYFQLGGVTTRPYGEAEYLRDQGVSVEAPANRRLRELAQPAEDFSQRNLNSTPTLAEAEDVLPHLVALRRALTFTNSDGAHPEQRDFSWGHLASACKSISRINELSCQTEIGAFVRDILLEAAEHPTPVHSPQYDAQFDQTQSWGMPAPRIDAAQGLPLIAWNPDCADETVLDSISRLSRDSVPAVRFQVAMRLQALHQTAPELMWSITERLCLEEPSRGVLQGLLNRTLPSLVGLNSDRAARLTKTIFDRVTTGAGAKQVREMCVPIFVRLHVWHDNPLSQEVVSEIADDPASYADVAGRVAFNLRSLLRYGPVEPPDPKQDTVRHRAQALLSRMTRSTVREAREFRVSSGDVPFDSWPREKQERYERLVKIADSVTMQVYFASGAYDSKRQGGEPQDSISNEEKRRFLNEIGPILDELADLGFPRLVHHLLETLEFLIDVDPAGIFLRIGQVVRAGGAGGYQYESLAVDLIVRLVERYLAEYRSVLRDDPECLQTLLEILDLFVEAGWPSARRLTYRMEEIFR
jgi:hypothetical protein